MNVIQFLHGLREVVALLDRLSIAHLDDSQGSAWYWRHALAFGLGD